MADPHRLLEEEGSPLERALLASARADRPPEASRRRVASALGLPIGGGIGGGAGASAAGSASSAAAGSAGATATGSGLLAKWIAIALLGGAMTGAALFRLTGSRETRRGGEDRGAPALAATAATPDATAPDAGVTSDAAPTAVTGQPARARVRATADAGAPEAGVTRDATAPDALARELALLDEARAALAGGDARAGLYWVEEHSLAFPDGVLAPEAELLRVEARLLLGERARAARGARRFLARHPNSPLAPRARELLGRAEGGR